MKDKSSTPNNSGCNPCTDDPNMNTAPDPGAATLARVEFTVDVNGRVVITGPIKNPILMLDLFARAMQTVANYCMKQDMKRKESCMVKPPILSPSGSPLAGLN